MKRIHGSSIAGFGSAVGLAMALIAATPVTWAEVWNKKTTVSFSQPVEVPGQVLQPGRYVMKLVDFQANRHIVQFMNLRENHVYASAIAIPAYRTNATDKTVITFYEAPAGRPESIRYWYYPGDNFGQEFVYRKAHFAKIAAVSHGIAPAVLEPRSDANAVAGAEPGKDIAPAPVASELPAGATAASESNQPVEIAQATPLKPAEPEAAPLNTPATPTELPRTGGNWPEIALLGLGALGGAATARRLRRS